MKNSEDNDSWIKAGGSIPGFR